MSERALTTAIVAALASALVAVALGLAAERPNHPGSAGAASSAVRAKLGNNKRGRAIIRFDGMAPGDSRMRRVRISNRGGPARLTLQATVVSAGAGPNGGSLDRALKVRVRQLRGARAKPARSIHRGRLSGVTRFGLGRWRARSARNYRFKVVFPDRGAPPSERGGDNAYQGARARVDFRWRARSAR